MNKTQIFHSYKDFLNRDDKKVNGVSRVFAKHNPDFEMQNVTNMGCWNCLDCRYCSGCSDKSYLSGGAKITGV